MPTPRTGQGSVSRGCRLRMVPSPALAKPPFQAAGRAVTTTGPQPQIGNRSVLRFRASDAFPRVGFSSPLRCSGGRAGARSLFLISEAKVKNKDLTPLFTLQIVPAKLNPDGVTVVKFIRILRDLTEVPPDENP